MQGCQLAENKDKTKNLRNQLPVWEKLDVAVRPSIMTFLNGSRQPADTNRWFGRGIYFFSALTDIIRILM